MPQSFAVALVRCDDMVDDQLPPTADGLSTFAFVRCKHSRNVCYEFEFEDSLS